MTRAAAALRGGLLLACVFVLPDAGATMPCPAGKTPLLGLDLTDGHPARRRVLAPDRSERQTGGRFTNHWSLQGVSQPWVACRYAPPASPQALPLPVGLRQCRVAHDAQAHPRRLQCR